jgi:hypothetical protein
MGRFKAVLSYAEIQGAVSELDMDESDMEELHGFLERSEIELVEDIDPATAAGSEVERQQFAVAGCGEADRGVELPLVNRFGQAYHALSWPPALEYPRRRPTTFGAGAAGGCVFRSWLGLEGAACRCDDALVSVVPADAVARRRIAAQHLSVARVAIDPGHAAYLEKLLSALRDG